MKYLQFYDDFFLSSELKNKMIDELTSYLIGIIPKVLRKVAKNADYQKHFKAIRQYFTLLENEKLPLNNICYLVFCDLLEYFSVQTLTQMRYSGITRSFWSCVKQVCGGMAISLLRGPVSRGNVSDEKISDQPGLYDPTNAKVNFPIPKEIDDLKDLESIPPGFIESNIDLYAEQLKASDNPNKGHNVAFDFKKLLASKEDPLGYINLMGFEPSPTYQDIEGMKLAESERCNDILKRINLVIDTKSKLEDLPQTVKNGMKQDLKELIEVQTSHIKDLRQHCSSKEYVLNAVLEKLIEGKTKDWTQTSWAFHISDLKTEVVESKKLIKNLLGNIDDCLRYINLLNGTSHHSQPTLKLSEQSNYVCLQGLEDVEDASSQSRTLKQRSSAWMRLRKSAIATGVLYILICLHLLFILHAIFSKVVSWFRFLIFQVVRFSMPWAWDRLRK